jgi:hypothetical protein
MSPQLRCLAKKRSFQDKWFVLGDGLLSGRGDWTPLHSSARGRAGSISPRRNEFPRRVVRHWRRPALRPWGLDTAALSGTWACRLHPHGERVSKTSGSSLETACLQAVGIGHRCTHRHVGMPAPFPHGETEFPRQVRSQTEFGNEGNSSQSRTRCKRNAFAITETELRLIAAPAITGLRSNPKNG